MNFCTIASQWSYSHSGVFGVDACLSCVRRLVCWTTH